MSKLHIIVIGPTGGGKTSTIRSIIKGNGDGIATKTDKQPYNRYKFTKNGRYIYIVDTAGSVDVDCFKREIKHQVDKFEDDKEIIKEVVFMVCVPMERCSENVNKKLEDYRKALTSNMLQHTMVIFTKTDVWEQRMKNEHSQKHIEQPEKQYLQIARDMFFANLPIPADFLKNGNHVLLNSLNPTEEDITQIYTNLISLKDCRGGFLL